MLAKAVFQAPAPPPPQEDVVVLTMSQAEARELKQSLGPLRSSYAVYAALAELFR